MSTRPVSGNGLGLEAARARREVELFLTTYPLLPNPDHLFRRWLHICTEHSVSGRPSYDARLAAFMDGHGIGTILTFNPSDFKRYDVRVISPDPT